MTIDISIIEDDSGFRQSLAVLINGTEGFRCTGAYANAETALKAIPRQWPHVLLADISLPKMDGIQCVSRLKAMQPSLQIIMLTACLDTDKIFDSLKAGASGYLIKKTPPAKILEALADVHAGGAPMSNSIARKVVQFFQPKPSADETRSLSNREYEILSQVSKGASYKEIGDTFSISALTVRTHIRNIYEKLHVHSRTEAVLKFLSK